MSPLRAGARGEVPRFGGFAAPKSPLNSDKKLPLELNHPEPEPLRTLPTTPCDRT
ncbi:MAG TPA: hypothetical protein IGS53_16890 [Leptolyngbyaceae cyanobacterium M33_DOE_097]|nr:hypothetical protein [Leptolyngbyaceae cyanobacterium M33_DOE_097]